MRVAEGEARVEGLGLTRQQTTRKQEDKKDKKDKPTETGDRLSPTPTEPDHSLAQLVRDGGGATPSYDAAAGGLQCGDGRNPDAKRKVWS